MVLADPSPGDVDSRSRISVARCNAVSEVLLGRTLHGQDAAPNELDRAYRFATAAVPDLEVSGLTKR